MLHGAGIFTYKWVIFRTHVGNIPYMEHMWSPINTNFTMNFTRINNFPIPPSSLWTSRNRRRVPGKPPHPFGRTPSTSPWPPWLSRSARVRQASGRSLFKRRSKRLKEVSSDLRLCSIYPECALLKRFNRKRIFQQWSLVSTETQKAVEIERCIFLKPCWKNQQSPYCFFQQDPVGLECVNLKKMNSFFRNMWPACGATSWDSCFLFQGHNEAKSGW